MKRLNMIAIALVLLATSAIIPPPANAEHVTQNIMWRERTGTHNGDTVKFLIAVCFDTTAPDNWPIASDGLPIGKAAVQGAMDRWNWTGGQLRFYFASSTCGQLYDDSSGQNVPFIKLSAVDLPDLLGLTHRFYGSGDTEAGSTNPSDSGCFTGFPSRCLDRVSIQIDRSKLLAQTAGAFYRGTSGTVPSIYYDLYSTVEHELGHTFIVGECNERSPACSSIHVMYNGLARGVNKRTLQSHDWQDYKYYYWNPW